MRQTRIVWRWLIAIALHVIFLAVFFQLSQMFYDGSVKAIAEATVPQGIRVQDWIGYWDSGWAQAIKQFMIFAAVISFGVFIIWNVIFAIPGVVYKGGKMAKILFFPALILVLAGEVVLGLLYHPVMAIEGFTGTVDLFVGNMVFYLGGIAYIVPFFLSLAFCSPFCIASFKNWFRS
jgi:hypothetical protein